MAAQSDPVISATSRSSTLFSKMPMELREQISQNNMRPCKQAVIKIQETFDGIGYYYSDAMPAPSYDHTSHYLARTTMNSNRLIKATVRAPEHLRPSAVIPIFRHTLISAARQQHDISSSFVLELTLEVMTDAVEWGEPGIYVLSLPMLHVYMQHLASIPMPAFESSDSSLLSKTQSAYLKKEQVTRYEVIGKVLDDANHDDAKSIRAAFGELAHTNSTVEVVEGSSSRSLVPAITPAPSTETWVCQALSRQQREAQRFLHLLSHRGASAADPGSYMGQMLGDIASRAQLLYRFVRKRQMQGDLVLKADIQQGLKEHVIATTYNAQAASMRNYTVRSDSRHCEWDVCLLAIAEELHVTDQLCPDLSTVKAPDGIELEVWLASYHATVLLHNLPRWRISDGDVLESCLEALQPVLDAYTENGMAGDLVQRDMDIIEQAADDWDDDEDVPIPLTQEERDEDVDEENLGSVLWKRLRRHGSQRLQLAVNCGGLTKLIDFDFGGEDDDLFESDFQVQCLQCHARQ